MATRIVSGPRLNTPKLLVSRRNARKLQLDAARIDVELAAQLLGSLHQVWQERHALIRSGAVRIGVAAASTAEVGLSAPRAIPCNPASNGLALLDLVLL